MPQPPLSDLESKGILKEILQIASEERSAAAERHKDILARFLTQQEVFKQQFSEMHTPYMSEPPSNCLCHSESAAKWDACAEEALQPVGMDGFAEPVAGQALNRAELSIPECCDQGTIAEVEPEEPPSPSKLLSRKSELAFGKKERYHEATCRAGAMDFVTSDRFEMTIALLILANALVMCWEVQRIGIEIGCSLKNRACPTGHSGHWPEATQAFEVLDYLFGAVFTIEAIIKISLFSWKYFQDGWNCLDLVCVMVFVVDKVAISVLMIDSQAMRMLRLFRLVRLAKLLRSLETLDALYLMTTALKGMTLVVVWAVALLVVMLTTCALFLTQFLHSTYFDNVTSDSALDTHQKMYEYYGTTTRCFLTMFELTLANWPTASRLLTEEVSEWFTPICLIFKLTVGFAVVGVINGVILQETFKVASTDDFIMVRQMKREKDALRHKLEVLFGALDSSEDGEVEYEEFDAIASQPDVAHWLSSMGIETHDLKTLFALIDVDGSGHISLPELLKQMPRIRGAARSFDLLALRSDTKH